MTATVADHILEAVLDGAPEPIRHPAPGRAVLACACGRTLDAADMRWAPKLLVAIIPAIVCDACVTAW